MKGMNFMNESIWQKSMANEKENNYLPRIINKFWILLKNLFLGFAKNLQLAKKII